MKVGWGEIGKVDGKRINGKNILVWGMIGMIVKGMIVVIKEYYKGKKKRKVN